MNGMINALIAKYGDACVAEPNGTYVIDVTEDDLNSSDIVQYIANLECYITRLKEIHWSASDDKTHNLTDSIKADLSYYQDQLAEDYMGIVDSKLQIGTLGKGCGCSCTTLPELLQNLRKDTIQMYNVLHDNYEFKGIESILNRILDVVNSSLYKETQK